MSKAIAEGSLVAAAVLAACAAPAYFPSVEIGGELYADGGLVAVALGTAFLACPESGASAPYKQAVLARAVALASAAAS